MTKDRRENLIAVAVVTWTFAATICRAIRRPNDFSEAHWLLDYRFGFMKRGLIGSICTLVTDVLGLQMNPSLIATLSIIALYCMSAAMLYLIVRAILRQQEKNGILVLGIVFASSPFVVMSAHLLGYFDSLLYLFALASVGLVLCNRPFLAALVSSAAILSHESYLLIGLPLVCLASLAVVTADGRRACWKPHLVAICIPVATFLAASSAQILTTDAMVLRSQLTERLDSFGFVSSRGKGIAIWQTTSFIAFFRQQSGDFDERLLDPIILASVAPTLLAIFVFIHSSFRIRVFSPFSIMLFGLVCAPFAMHAVAWDTARIATFSIGGGFIAWWILAETRTAQPSNSVFLLIALLALILNTFGRIPLMDGAVERFSAPLRLLLYLPALSFLTAAIVRISRNADSG